MVKIDKPPKSNDFGGLYFFVAPWMYYWSKVHLTRFFVFLTQFNVSKLNNDKRLLQLKKSNFYVGFKNRCLLNFVIGLMIYTKENLVFPNLFDRKDYRMVVKFGVKIKPLLY